MKSQTIKWLRMLSEMNAVSGQENEVAAFLAQQYTAMGYPLVKDNLGSIFAYKKSSATQPFKVVVLGHMDEVGFMAISIQKNGMVKAIEIGGLNPINLQSQRVRLKTKQGSYLFGAIDSTPPHLLKEGPGKTPEVESLYFDFGFSSKAEAEQAGVYVGAMITFDAPFRVLHHGKRFLGKAFDNRYSLALGLEVLKSLKHTFLPFDLYVGASVQEEVGTRGAQTAAQLLKPDMVFVLDCSPARDSSGDAGELGQLGHGVLLRFIDSSMIAAPALLEFQEKAAKKSKVASQFYQSPGGTDAGAVHKSLDGILTLTHCITARSIHSASTVMDAGDFDAAQKSLLYMLKHLKAADLTKFKEARR